ncbi:MAG: alkyl hydroperoxide reductase subunit AhpC, partial [Saprospiraceae bacterium]
MLVLPTNLNVAQCYITIAKLFCFLKQCFLHRLLLKNISKNIMRLNLGDTAPNFSADSTQGTIDFYDWLGDSWGLLFSHPQDYTPVCTTELGMVANLKNQFVQRNVKNLALSVDNLASHKAWVKEIEEVMQVKIDFPIIADDKKEIAELYGMIHRNSDNNFTIRSVFV